MKLALSEANVTRPAAQTIGLISLLVLILTLAYSSTPVRGDPAPEWVNFFSSNTTFFGQPVPVGAVIAAFDPQGVQCGQFTVVEEGKYGLLACYGDDPATPEDEGPQPGEPISFKINGLPATPVPISLNGNPVPPSTTVTWTSFSDRWEVDLHVVAPPPPPVPVGGYIVPVNRLELLTPWLNMTAMASLVALTVALVRRRRG
ncbi:MAG: hypothetical protein FJ014_06835 [Chloroflexi bacterium]|nr:hypothetical protein [Chloroflexota bacterium]